MTVMTPDSALVADTVCMTPGQIIASHQRRAPVNVVGIAQDMGIRVWEMDNLPEGISGQIWKDPLNGGLSGYSIGVRAAEPAFRKRFTVAHEISHYILHFDKLDGGIYEDTMYRGGLSTREEAQANQMAAEILMPFALINQLINEGCDTLEKLAGKLEVSLAALKIRLNAPA